MHRANVLDVVVQLHIVKTMVKILTQFTKASIITNAYTAVPVFTAVCRSVFCSMSQKNDAARITSILDIQMFHDES